MKHLTLPNNIETISQLNAFVDTLCEEWSIDMDLAMSLNLAIEEAVVNVMDYAYPEGTVGYVDIEADSVSYEYKDHKNILTLRKKISK